MAELKMERVTERAMVAGSGLALIAGTAALDNTIRDRIRGLFTGSAMDELSVLGAYVNRATSTATQTIGYHGAEDTTLVFFAVGAVVLLVLMLKT